MHVSCRLSAFGLREQKVFLRAFSLFTLMRSLQKSEQSREWRSSTVYCHTALRYCTAEVFCESFFAIANCSRVSHRRPLIWLEETRAIKTVVLCRGATLWPLPEKNRQEISASWTSALFPHSMIPVEILRKFAYVYRKSSRPRVQPLWRGIFGVSERDFPTFVISFWKQADQD